MICRLVSSASDERLSGQGSRQGTASDHSLLHVKNVVRAGRECDEMGKGGMERLKRETGPFWEMNGR